MAKQKKFILQESEIPTQWYNIQADMPNKPMPPIHPATKQPLGVDDLAHIFPRECCVQELDTEHRWIDIPEDVLEKYKYYRSTPLVRAYALEEALGTPAHIYFKNESTNPLGSHKINSALPSAITPSRKERPTSPPRQVQASGAQPSPMPPRSTVSTAQSIR